MEAKARKQLIAEKLISDRTTYEGGLGLSSEIDPVFRQGGQVEVSMEGINNLSSSFLHGAIGVLIDKFGEAFVKENIRFVGLSSFVKRQLIDYFNTYKAHPSGRSRP